MDLRAHEKLEALVTFFEKIPISSFSQTKNYCLTLPHEKVVSQIPKRCPNLGHAGLKGLSTRRSGQILQTLCCLLNFPDHFSCVSRFGHFQLGRQKSDRKNLPDLGQLIPCKNPHNFCFGVFELEITQTSFGGERMEF